MITRNESVRHLETAIYRAAVREAAERFAEALFTDETLSSLRLSVAEYESGNWAIPDAYEPVVLRIMAKIALHQQYDLSAAQLREALICGAERADRLIVEGDPSPSKALTIVNLPREHAGRHFNWLHYEVPK